MYEAIYLINGSNAVFYYINFTSNTLEKSKKHIRKGVTKKYKVKENNYNNNNKSNLSLSR